MRTVGQLSDAAERAGEFSWLGELNPEQRRAVTHGEGPLLVVAGAGSGKTRTLAYRVAYLLARGVAPERILLLTFTRRAAEEMLRRAAAIAERGPGVAARVWGGTFHATANRLLRVYARALGLHPEFTVLDESDAEDLLEMLRHERGLAGRGCRFPRKATCRAIYSRCVNGADDLSVVLARYFPWCVGWEEELCHLFRAYVARKQQLNVLDYDDLLLYWARALDDESLAHDMGARFDHVLVDEYQDTNVLQAQILRGLRRFCPNVMVVGDDAQSIFGFRAATVRNMLDFPRHFPGAAVVTLERNYRSVAPILETAGRLIAEAREGYPKILRAVRGDGARPRLVLCRDERQQDDFVASTVLRHYEEGIPLHRQAVLFRVAHLSDTLEVELGRCRIPYRKYGGLRFVEAAHVKDLLAFLRIAENPRDEIAWLRVLLLLDGIGPATASSALAHLRARAWDPVALADFDAPATARPSMAGLVELFQELRRLRRQDLAAQVQRIRDFYDPLLERRYENAAVRQRDLLHLEHLARGYASRRVFLAELTLEPPSATGDWAASPVKGDDWLVLSTIHSAKGGEWDVVFLIHAVDGWLPSDMATGSDEEIEEERRLAYVAMTRARDHLYVVCPQRYYQRGPSPGSDRYTHAQLSRFLSPQVCATMERVVVGADVGEDEPSAMAPRVPVRDRVRRMWA